MANLCSRHKPDVEENYCHENKVISLVNCECVDDPLTVESENPNKMSSREGLQVQTDTTLREEQNGDVPLEEEGNKVCLSEGVKREPSQERNGIYGDTTTPMFEKTLKHNPSEDGENSQASGEIQTYAPRSHGLEKKQDQSKNDVITKSVEERDDSWKFSRYIQEIPAAPMLNPDGTGKLKNEESTQTTLTAGRQGKNNKKKRKPPENRKLLDHLKWLHSVRTAVKWRWLWIFGLLMMQASLPVHGAAAPPRIDRERHDDVGKGYDYRCSDDGSSREDDVLDAKDVILGLSGTTTFDGSGKNYTKVCSNAFHHVPVEVVYLANNLLQDLPYGIFDYTTGLKRVYLNGNKFTKFPLAHNSLTDLKLLNLSDNKIFVIPKGSMNGMKSLTSLYLSGNQNMTQVPDDVFVLVMNHSLKSVFVKNTKIQHPLVPAPHFMLCTTDNPCNVTHKDGGIVITLMNGNSITFEITQNGDLPCEELKEQLEADNKIVNGPINCKNNVLGGSVNIVRKRKNGVDTDVTNGPDLTKGYAPTTEIAKEVNLVPILVCVGIIGITVFIAFIALIVVVRKGVFKCKPNPTEINTISDNGVDLISFRPLPQQPNL